VQIINIDANTITPVPIADTSVHFVASIVPVDEKNGKRRNKSRGRAKDKSDAASDTRRLLLLEALRVTVGD